MKLELHSVNIKNNRRSKSWIKIFVNYIALLINEIHITASNDLLLRLFFIFTECNSNFIFLRFQNLNLFNEEVNHCLL
jgi:hypothetical protein